MQVAGNIIFWSLVLALIMGIVQFRHFSEERDKLLVVGSLWYENGGGPYNKYTIVDIQPDNRGTLWVKLDNGDVYRADSFKFDFDPVKEPSK